MIDEQSILNQEYGNALLDRDAADLRYAKARDENWWAVKLGLHPFQDGNQWCVLWGKNLMEGVSAFGETPIAAIRNFDVAVMNQLAQPETRECKHPNGFMPATEPESNSFEIVDYVCIHCGASKPHPETGERQP